MIARFHGQQVSLEALRQDVHLEQRGASLEELQQVAAALGFRSRAVRVGSEQLANVHLPAVGHLDNGHYVVIYSLDGDKLQIGDPSAGILTVTAQAFRRTWTGSLLLLMYGDQRSIRGLQP